MSEPREWNHTDIMVAVARLEENQSAFREDIKEVKAMLRDNLISTHVECAKTDERLKLLENFKARAVGAYVALAAIFAAVGTYLGIYK